MRARSLAGFTGFHAGAGVLGAADHRRLLGSLGSRKGDAGDRPQGQRGAQKERETGKMSHGSPLEQGSAAIMSALTIRQTIPPPFAVNRYDAEFIEIARYSVDLQRRR